MKERMKCKFCEWNIESVDETKLEKMIAQSQLETHIEIEHPEKWANYLMNGGRVTTF